MKKTNPIINWLNQPYPFIGSWWKHLWNTLWGGLFVTLFLLVFKPFNIRYADGYAWEFFLMCLAFGLATSFSMLVFAAITFKFTRFFNEASWVVWKEILSNILVVMMIGTANMLLANVLFHQKMTLAGFGFWQMATLAIGIFPILFTAYTKHHILQKRHASHAGSLTDKIHAHPTADRPDEPILQLAGDNQNESLEIRPADLLYMEAADNYVRMFYHKNGGLENQLFRSTLKKMELQLEGHPQFFRCHRTYLVNLNKVVQVSGNAQGYKLHLNGYGAILPVSRSLNREIDKRL